MHKTTLLVDDAKLRRARKVLGTRGIRDTVDRALDEVIALSARRRFSESLQRLEGFDRDVLLTVRGRAWR